MITKAERARTRRSERYASAIKILCVVCGRSYGRRLEDHHRIIKTCSETCYGRLQAKGAE